MPTDFDMSQIDLGSGADIDGFLSSPADEQGGIYTTGSILQNIMPKVASKDDFELGAIQGQGSPGLDALFDQQPQLLQARSGRRFVASCSDLKAFVRISSDTLVHKSNNELWALRKEADGKFYVERLFDDNGSPLKG
jgi:hypothetical protein